MNRPTVLESPTPNRSRRAIGLGLGAAAAALMLAITLAAFAHLGGSRSTVERITYDNPTEYALSVEVRPGTGGGWTSAGFVGQHSTGVAEEVPDQGDLWVFRFDSQGETGGELRLPRSELVASGWKVTVPDEVGRRLLELGAPPTP